MSAVLRGLGVLLYYLGLSRVIRWLNREVPRVLAYHACENEESPFLKGLRCNTRPDVFRRQLAHLAAHYHVISIDQLEKGDIPPRAVVLTFDDGYRSVHENALPALRERRMPALVYLVTSTIDGTRLVWVNELNWFLHTHASAAAVAAAAMGLPGGTPASALIVHVQTHETPARIESLLDDLARRFQVDRKTLAREAKLYLSAAEIEAMRNAGVTFGNHTYSHPNLALLPDAECRDEIARGARSDGGKERVPGGVHPTLAYPFGSYTESVRRTALELGVVSLAEIGGWNRPLELTRLARTPVYATTDAEFFAELEVVYPVKTRLRRLLSGRRQAPTSRRSPSGTPTRVA
jgi:peptidoglycan/xylan/chitin deacetylase (PgdA/CDA1 family)